MNFASYELRDQATRRGAKMVFTEISIEQHAHKS